MPKAWAAFILLLASAMTVPAAAVPLGCPCQDCPLVRGITREPYPGTGEPQVVDQRAGKAMATLRNRRGRRPPG